ncbi:hypothetical protein CEXT_701941 [Caerostris extrusa]|uniref:Uncharacterized protein n=1 Tax=Caerostris extrusa TaxID=172846 RepID=A0AAV4VLB6_CAEEX|nr:hypothetical protein CEXT_701941 [Caerostris extrusa]
MDLWQFICMIMIRQMKVSRWPFLARSSLIKICIHCSINTATQRDPSACHLFHPRGEASVHRTTPPAPIVLAPGHEPVCNPGGWAQFRDPFSPEGLATARFE